MLYEENKVLKERVNQNSSQLGAAETSGTVVEEVTGVSSTQPNLEQSAAHPEFHTAEPSVAIAEPSNQQPPVKGTEAKCEYV